MRYKELFEDIESDVQNAHTAVMKLAASKGAAPEFSDEERKAMLDKEIEDRDLDKEDGPINRLSPLTIPPKRFVNDRASGPAGARNVDGSIKDRFKDGFGKGKLDDDQRGYSINPQDEEIDDGNTR